MSDGSVRIKKRYFDRNIRGKHSRMFSASPNFAGDIQPNQQKIEISDQGGENKLIQQKLRFELVSMTSEATHPASNRQVKVHVQNFNEFLVHAGNRKEERAPKEYENGIEKEVQKQKNSQKKMQLLIENLRMKNHQERI